MLTQATHIFLFQLLNIGGITLLIAANSRVQQNRAEAQEEASTAIEATGDGDEGSGAPPSPAPPEMWWAQLTSSGGAAGRYDFALDYR